MEPTRFECQSIYVSFMDRDVEPPCHVADLLTGTICEFFMDRNEPAHLSDWVIHETEGIGYASYDGGQWNGSVFCSIFVG